MKIAIYHNLRKGGALKLVSEIIQVISKEKNHSIDIFSPNKELQNERVDNHFRFEFTNGNNIFSDLFNSIFILNSLDNKIAKKINDNNYDLVLVFPCIKIQSPHVLKYLNQRRNTVIYMFTEPKREFYENVSFDHNSMIKTASRVFRIPIKLVDKINCKAAKNIITVSHYEQYLLKEIYNKKSYVIQPGLEELPSKTTKKTNNHKALSVGLLSKIKGHEFSINQVKNTIIKLSIFGRNSHESFFIYNKVLGQKNIKIVRSKNEKVKQKLFLTSSIYLANQINEPFGLSTLEATNNNLFILGKNGGGTSEIVKHGLNGHLYPDNLKTAKMVLENILNQKNLNIIKTATINWELYVKKILFVSNLIKSANE